MSFDKFIQSCTHHQHQDPEPLCDPPQNSFVLPLLTHPCLHPQPLATTDLFSTSTLLPLPKCPIWNYVMGNLLNLDFFSHSIMHLRFFHVLASIMVHFFKLLNSILLYE